MGEGRNPEFKKSVLVLQRRLTAYRVPLFERLRERLAAEGIRLEVAYGRPTAAEAGRDDRGVLEFGRPVGVWETSVAGLRMNLLRLPRGFVGRQDLIILPHENRFLPRFLALAGECRRGVPRLAFWGHGRNFQAPPGGWRQRLGRWTGRRAGWWFAYTALSEREVAGFGFPRDRITVLNNAVDTRQLRAWGESIHPAETAALRRALGLDGRCVGVFLGSLTPEKHLGTLFAAADRIRAARPDFELLVLGDGPERDLVKAEVGRRPWVRWTAARAGREKVLHLALAKVMLNPGMVGLNILDGFALGLPLVITGCGIHSPEIAYLEDGRNGLLTPDRVEDFAAAAIGLLNDEARRERMAAACRQDAEKYCLENMVDRFVRGILSALEVEPGLPLASSDH